MLIKLLTAFGVLLLSAVGNHQDKELDLPSSAQQVEESIRVAQENPQEPDGHREFIKRALLTQTELGNEFTFQNAVERVASLREEAQYEAALEMAIIAESLDRPNFDKSISGQLYLHKALIQIHLGDVFKAIESLRFAEAIEAGQPKKLSLINNYLGICFRAIGHEQEALKAMKRSLELADEANFHECDFAVRSNLASLLLSLGETSQAETHLKLLLPSSVDENRHAYIQANLGLAEVALLRGEYEAARSRAQRVFDTCDLDDNFFAEQASVAQLLIGRCYLAEEQYSLASENCKLALDRLQDNSSHVDKARMNLGLSNLGEGKTDEGVLLIKQVAEKARNIRTKKQACIKLVDHFSTQNEFQSALKYEKLDRAIGEDQQEKRLQLAESHFFPQLLVDRDARFVDQLNARIDAEKAKSKHTRLKAETSMKEASKNWVIWNLKIWSFGIVLVSCLFFFRSQARIRQAKIDAIESQNRAEQELAESRERAELERQLAHKRRIESIGQLTGNVAHDFNNILQVVSFSNQLLEESIEESLHSYDRQLLASANDAVELGARITSQLLSFAGKQQSDPQPTLAIKFFEENELLFSSVGGDEVKIELEDLTPELVINVDRGQLSNALLNLLVNARRALGGKGVVNIRMSQFSDERDFTIPEESQRIFLKIDVIDKGCGMSNDEIEKACEPYYTTKPAETGSGLGLSGVKGFIDQLHGRLEIESEKDIGTTVSLLLPATIDNFLEDDQVTVETAEFETIEAARCLIVEDNPAVQRSIVAFLEIMKFECHCCMNADEAHALLDHDSNFQIVISDIRMPGNWDGADLAQWIAVNYEHISTILISGNAAPLHLDNCQFLRKPFRFDDLQKAISRSLETSPST